MATLSKNARLIEFRRPSLVPERWEDSVRVIGMSECKEAGLALAHAFAADDLSQYLVDSDDMTAEEKWRLHVDIMTYIAAGAGLNGVVTTIGPDYDAVALWMPPGKHIDGWWTLLRSGLWRLYFQLSPEGKKRYYAEMIPLLAKTKTEVLGEHDDDSYYLMYIGTKPNARGRGYARKLIESMTEKADAEGRLIYLESSSASNTTYYRRFGFEVKKDVFLERGTAPIPISIMVRQPQPLRKSAYPSLVVKF